MKEALKLALEALERSVATCFDQYSHQQVMSQPDHFINKAITAIKEALAQEQEHDGECKYCTDGCPACDARKLPPQRTWVGLTGEEEMQIYIDCRGMRELLDAIDAKLKDKNTRG